MYISNGSFNTLIFALVAMGIVILILILTIVFKSGDVQSAAIQKQKFKKELEDQKCDFEKELENQRRKFEKELKDQKFNEHQLKLANQKIERLQATQNRIKNGDSELRLKLEQVSKSNSEKDLLICDLEKELSSIKEQLSIKTVQLDHFYIKYLNHNPKFGYSKYVEKGIDQVYRDLLSSFETEEGCFDYVSSLVVDYLTWQIRTEEDRLKQSRLQRDRLRGAQIQEIREEAQRTLKRLYITQYRTERILALDIRTLLEERATHLSSKNLEVIPYMAQIMADIETSNIEIYAKSLEHGTSIERTNKVKSIREIRAESKARIEQIKWAEYQLNYLLNLYPDLQQVIETDYKDLNLSFGDIQDVDPIRHYLSKEEWEHLSSSQRNQLALDRYVASRKKSKWQIGRDYELFIGHLYQQSGYNVDFYGSYMGLEDLGRDLIAKNGNTTLIIQCKYWSHEKQIHEKHIMQLYGSMISYQIEQQTTFVRGMLITNITLSETAKKFAAMLNIEYIENKDIEDFPRIKCNIGHDENGSVRIYHLPMDFQYDKTKIDKPGEIMAMTVAEAEAAGFRRAYKWHGEKQ